MYIWNFGGVYVSVVIVIWVVGVIGFEWVGVRDGKCYKGDSFF